MTGRYDAIVVGAGQNGLVAAAYLAKAGRKVLVLERRSVVGGTNTTVEFHPDFRVDAAFHQQGWLDPRISADLSVQATPEATASVLSLTAGGAFVLPGSTAAAVEAIRRISAADAAKWEEFCRLMHRLGGVLQYLYGLTPPRLTSTRPTDLLALLGLGLKVRGLGKRDMIEFLRILPMSAAELLDDWFESDVLKGTLGAAAITGICQGPRSAGTAFVMLHHLVGSPAGLLRGGGLTAGMAGRMSQRLAEAAKKTGVETRTGAEVVRIVTKDGRAIGVALASGEEFFAAQVVSTVDPRRTMLGLVNPTELEPEYARAVQNIRYRGVQAKVNLALAEAPRFNLGGGGSEMLRGLISISPSLDYLERAYDDVKHGGVSKAPVLEAFIPTMSDPSLAPAGKHVMSIWMQYAPYRPKAGEWDAAGREALGDRVVDTLAAHAPNLRAAIVHRQVLTPRDLGDEYGATEGNLYHGEMGLDQILFMRPVPGWGHHGTPIPGLFLGGSGTHPGGGIVGGAGRLAAREMLKAKGARS